MQNILIDMLPKPICENTLLSHQKLIANRINSQSRGDFTI